MRIGITGGVGSGKSTVSRILESIGYEVFYSDLEAKKIIHTDLQVRQEIIDLLGEEAFVDKVYNIPFVSSKIFQNEDLKNGLNAIVHPRVRAAFERFEKQHTLVFNEAAIMYETGLYRQMDATILIVSPLELRLKRTMSRDNSTREQVEMRIRNQWSDEQKMAFADYILENNEEKALLPQINQILDELN